jgi:hypothetical protein
MIKWADYLITDIKCIDINGKRYIDEVEVYKEIDDLGKEGSWWSREKLISLINIGNSFCIIFKGKNWWIPGPCLSILCVKDKYYLKAFDNEDEKDDLQYFII